MGRVGSGGLGSDRIGSDRVGSGGSTYHKSGPVTVTRPDRTGPASLIRLANRSEKYFLYSTAEARFTNKPPTPRNHGRSNYNPIIANKLGDRLTFAAVSSRCRTLSGTWFHFAPGICPSSLRASTAPFSSSLRPTACISSTPPSNLW